MAGNRRFSNERNNDRDGRNAGRGGYRNDRRGGRDDNAARRGRDFKKERPVAEKPEGEVAEANDSDSEFLEGRNNVYEAYKAGRTIDKLFVLDGANDFHIQKVIKEAKKAGTLIKFVTKERLDQLSFTHAHQGVIAIAAAMEYYTVDDMLKDAEEKGEDPFLILLDGIEDPHNLGAIIRTANAVGAHGVVITKHHAVSVTATVAKASAGAINYTKVAKVTNLATEIDKLKQKGLWMVCADMDGDVMYDVNLKGSIGLVIGNEGKGVSRLVREKCDFTASIPLIGQIESLNASVATAVLAYEIHRQRR